MLEDFKIIEIPLLYLMSILPPEVCPCEKKDSDGCAVLIKSGFFKLKDLKIDSRYSFKTIFGMV
jgi:hypothetical protein